MTAHARLSASGSHRWLHCPGSVAAETGLPDAPTVHSLEGSAAHALAEHCLNEGVLDASGAIGRTFGGMPVTQEMADAVQVYVDYIRNVGGFQQYETRLDFSRWVPEGFGTSDCITIADNTLHVIDLKYGKGVRVNAFENTQGLLYALGALDECEMLYSFDKVQITIVQPRLDHISEWVLTLDELNKWGDWIKERALLACAPDAPRVPSESACHWCKAKATCPALKTYTEAAILSEFSTLEELLPVDTLSDDELARALSAKKLITGWLDAVEEHATQRCINGEGFPGFKLVAGRSLRQWGDEGEAELVLKGALGDDAFEHKLLSVAKAEKALGKKQASLLDGLVVKPEGKPVLVPNDDPREPLGTAPAEFDKL